MTFKNDMCVTVADVETYAKEIGKTKQEVFQMILDTFVAGGVNRGEGLDHIDAFRDDDFFGITADYDSGCTWGSDIGGYLEDGEVATKLNVRQLLGASDTPPEYLLKDGVRVWFDDGSWGMLVYFDGISAFEVWWLTNPTVCAPYLDVKQDILKLTYMGETLWEKPRKKRVLTLQEIADKFGVDVDDIKVEGL